MNKGHIFCVIVGLCGICASFSQEQEFIKQPKEKKICPSRQQHIELDASIVEVMNDLSLHLSMMSQEIIALEKRVFTEINRYMSSDRECLLNKATKKQRVKLYQIKEQLKADVPEMIEKIMELKEKITRSMVAF